ncbi:MAG TPA: SRPBCC family protein [Acidobacteriaceae bacterium]|nr:SRPBCC family protein [Acidobacteriaceae bacterium]
MFTIRDSILIQAPIDRIFALSTSIAIVERELGMHPTAGGRTSGLVTAGDIIRWQGMQFGFPNYHVSLIVPDTWDPPHFFQDRMIAGRFRSFEHDHRFTETAEGTRLDDEVRFSMKLRWGGALTGRTIVAPRIRGLMRRRFHRLKRLAETEEWRQSLVAV